MYPSIVVEHDGVIAAVVGAVDRQISLPCQRPVFVEDARVVFDGGACAIKSVGIELFIAWCVGEAPYAACEQAETVFGWQTNERFRREKLFFVSERGAASRLETQFFWIDGYERGLSAWGRCGRGCCAVWKCWQAFGGAQAHVADICVRSVAIVELEQRRVVLL